jgi:hypothetical protein
MFQFSEGAVLVGFFAKQGVHFCPRIALKVKSDWGFLGSFTKQPRFSSEVFREKATA